MESFEKPDLRGRAFVNTMEKPRLKGRAFATLQDYSDYLHGCYVQILSTITPTILAHTAQLEAILGPTGSQLGATGANMGQLGAHSGPTWANMDQLGSNLGLT